MSHSLVSLIICTYNRERFLEKCIDSLVVQTSDIKAIEVIVVDNNSTDGTHDVVTRYRNRIPAIKYVFEKEQGLSHARNRGCREASGEYLAYLDDDATAPPQYLENIVDVITHHHPDILGGPIYPYYLDPKPRWFKDEYEIRKHAEKTGFIDSCRASGGNFIIRRDLLIQLGMFDVNLGMIGETVRLGEERAVIERYRELTPPGKRKGYYSLECYVNHYVPPSKMKIRNFLKRFYAAGKSSVLVKNKKPKLAIRKMVELFPHMIGDIRHQIKKSGWKHIDFLYVASRSLIRLGNIVQLFKYGPVAVFKPHIKRAFGKIKRGIVPTQLNKGKGK
ncbi:MAG: glycosyltransferase family 2 protein [Candidatus Omnitrophota bacterium]